MYSRKLFLIPVRFLRSQSKKTTEYPVARLVRPVDPNDHGYGKTPWDDEIPSMEEMIANMEKEKASHDKSKSKFHRKGDQPKDHRKGDQPKEQKEPKDDMYYKRKKLNRKVVHQMAEKESWHSDEIALDVYESSSHERTLLKSNKEFWTKNNFPKNSFIRKFHKQELLDFKSLMDFSIKHADEGAISAENQHERLTDSVLPLRNIPYNEQLKLKQNHMANILIKLQDQMNIYFEKKGPKKDITKKPEFWLPSCYDQSPMPCELAGIRYTGNSSQFRNTSEFSINVGVDGNPNTVGFYVGRPSQLVVCVTPEHLVNVKDSHKLVAKHFQNFIRSTNYTACLNYADGGVWKNILVRSTEDGQLMIVAIINPRELQPDQILDIQEKFKNYYTTGPAKDCGVTSILFQSSLKTRSSAEDAPFILLHGTPHIVENINGQTFEIKPDSFFQTNSQACAVLFNAVKELIGINSHATVLDACCGTGAMGIQIARNVRSVIGIDPIASSIEDAKNNAERNGLRNCSFYQGTVESLMPTLAEDFENLSEVIAIVNPPKNGLSPNAINQLRMCPAIRKIIYVSCRPSFAFSNFDQLCNPKKARNVKCRMPSAFRPMYAIPVDMFPHTPYAELAILFERRDTKFV